MRYFRYAFLIALGLILITVALANRAVVELRLLPADLADFFGLSFIVHLPLFVIIFAGIVAGLLIGFVWEWIREYKQRAEAARVKREVSELKSEVSRLRGNAGEHQDEVLALLEESGATR
ncbi:MULTISPECIES: LapA family protein [Halocynthiibacter]|uniref:LapA family protein n=1 Tax=Halocynthiibacter halioticoli TaxID=2986804 RepID=A0AAE3J0W9_9RHOB|nr:MULTISPECIES: LapA family protein [Halocynthiibacter]MCV6825319.1 LapA family protein [Halocynthiibacter halioticoli]MCW4058320.1 LapA family protein [Halocynthiibacter sp. SDUM655004]MDE0588659.1 LapA family protein [Halocynthiibacter sp. C4]